MMWLFLAQVAFNVIVLIWMGWLKGKFDLLQDTNDYAFSRLRSNQDLIKSYEGAFKQLKRQNKQIDLLIKVRQIPCPHHKEAPSGR